jgi:hypothetical protein
MRVSLAAIEQLRVIAHATSVPREEVVRSVLNRHLNAQGECEEHDRLTHISTCVTSETGTPRRLQARPLGRSTRDKLTQLSKGYIPSAASIRCRALSCWPTMHFA